MKRLFATALLFFTLQPVSTAAFAATSTREDQPVGVVEMFDFAGDFGTLTRAASGVPRAKPNPFLEAMDRWRAGAEPFTHGFAVSRGANGTESFKTRRVYEDKIGQAHVRLSQTIAGLPVVGSELIVHAEFQTGKVLGVHGRFAIDRGLARVPRMNAGEAIAAALSEYGLATARIEGPPELTYIIDDQNEIRLAWTNVVTYSSENGGEIDRIYADALTGAAITRHPQIRRGKVREMYDWGNTDNSYVFLFGEGGASTNATANAAYYNGGIVYDYWAVKHGRDGLNDAGIALKQGVSYSYAGYDGAGWIDNYSMIIYGDGENSTVLPLGYSLDIVAHEFTHGVIHYESDLSYLREGGMIDEGLADVFAQGVDAYHEGTADWWIGEDVHTKSISGDAMRYLNDPARKSGYADYYPKRTLNVTHENAGITGLAFYLLAHGGTHPRRPSASVMGIGITDAAEIFYHTIMVYMTSKTDFRTLSYYSGRAAVDLFGLQAYGTRGPSTEIVAAWTAVGNNWNEYYAPSLATGASWISPSYTTTVSGRSTGQLYGNKYMSNLHLYLEKWNGSAWTTYYSLTTVSATKVLEPGVSAGTYRWRVEADIGSGSFWFYWNRPY